VRQEGAEEQIDLLARDELLGHAHRIAGVAVVVAGDDLDLASEQPPGGVDLLERELPALAVRLVEGRLRLVAVQLADADRRLRLLRVCACGYGGEREAEQQRSDRSSHRRLLVRVSQRKSTQTVLAFDLAFL